MEEKNVIKERNTIEEKKDTGDKNIIKNECMICLEDMMKTDILHKTHCEHYFHKNCFDKYIAANRRNKKKCPLCNKLLGIPTVDDEMIEEEIDSYISDWGNLDCDDMIELLKLTYKDKFVINEDYIKQKCEERKSLIGGNKRLKQKNKRNKSKRTNRNRTKRSHNKRTKRGYIMRRNK